MNYYFQVFFNLKVILYVAKKPPTNTATEPLSCKCIISLQNVKNPEVLSVQSNNISDFTALLSKSMMTI